MIHIHIYQLYRGLTSGTTNPDLNCYILQNGALQQIAQAISMPSVSDASAKSTRAQTPVAKASSHSNDSEVSTNIVDPSKSNKRKETQNR